MKEYKDEFEYNIGDIVNIYKDPQTQEELLGQARLREYRGTGLPFILEDASTEAEQRTYVLDEWKIEWLFVDYKLVTEHPWWFREDRPYKIRKVHKVGL